MKRLHLAPLLLGLSLAAMTGLASAQNAVDTMAVPMKMSRADFLNMFNYDTVNDMWVLKPGMAPPAGVRSRAEVQADRDMFLSNNRYDNATSKWIPLGGTPRQMSAMSREEVRMETAHFLRTHRYDEPTSKWTARTGGGAQ